MSISNQVSFRLQLPFPRTVNTRICDKRELPQNHKTDWRNIICGISFWHLFEIYVESVDGQEELGGYAWSSSMQHVTNLNSLAGNWTRNKLSTTVNRNFRSIEMNKNLQFSSVLHLIRWQFDIFIVQRFIALYFFFIQVFIATQLIK